MAVTSDDGGGGEWVYSKGRGWDVRSVELYNESRTKCPCCVEYILPLTRSSCPSNGLTRILSGTLLSEPKILEPWLGT